MNHTFQTLHDFMLHTKSVTYIVIVLALFGFLFFWRFLNGDDRR